MKIAEIKEQLSIATVLSHYGLSANRNGMVCCPFHGDRKASMKVYEHTNTVYCFAGSCDVNYLDVIGFIETKESCSKHEAILKAKELCNYVEIPKTKIKPKRMSKTSTSSVFKKYQLSLPKNELAKKYCESRCLDWEVLEIGYKSQNTREAWGRNCIMFGLKDRA